MGQVVTKYTHAVERGQHEKTTPWSAPLDPRVLNHVVAVVDALAPEIQDVSTLRSLLHACAVRRSPRSPASQ